MLQLKAALLKSTAPWKLGVVQSDTLVDRQWSPTGRSMALLGGLVLKPDGETHASVRLCWGTWLDWGCNGQEQTWGSHLT